MTDSVRSVVLLVQYVLNRVAVAGFALIALALLAATGLALAGVWPWLEFQAAFGGVVYENAGQIAQIAITVLAVLLCFFLPANFRIMALENSHRRFHIGMQDVARAYATAHAADRAGMFQIYSDDKVDRARAFLKQRQQEVEQFNKRIDHAKQVSLKLKQWAQDVEMEESVAVSQLERIREDLSEILPELGYQEVARLDGTVVDMTKKAAE